MKNYEPSQDKLVKCASNRLYGLTNHFEQSNVDFRTGSGSLTGLAVPVGCCHCLGYMAGAAPHSLLLTWTRQPSHVRLCLRSPCVAADWPWRHCCIIPAVELMLGLAADTREPVRWGSGWPSFPGKEPSCSTWGAASETSHYHDAFTYPLGFLVFW